MMIAAFAMGGWVGAHMDGSIWPMVQGILFWSVLISTSAWVLVQRAARSRGA
jgi:DHA1 family bicyclomycin/chloramphenicol resistance-like MFS transporter